MKFAIAIAMTRRPMIIILSKVGVNNRNDADWPATFPFFKCQLGNNLSFICTVTNMMLIVSLRPVIYPPLD